MHLTVYPLRGLGLSPGCGGLFQGIFPWLIMFCQPFLSQSGRKWVNLDSKAPCEHRKGKPMSNQGQTKAKEKNIYEYGNTTRKLLHITCLYFV